MDAAGHQIAVKPDVVDLPHRNNHSAGLADLSQRVDVIERIAALGQINHQDVRACGNRQRLHSIAQAALVALLWLPAHLDDDRAQNFERGFVAQKCGEGIAVTWHCCLPWRVHDAILPSTMRP